MNNPKSAIRNPQFMQIPFVKMVATGNDFLLVDARRPRRRALKARWPQVARALCDRRYGMGADGLLVLVRSAVADVRMRIFNADGSEAEMCGNGARCAAWYATRVSANGRTHQSLTTRLTIETKAGRLVAGVERQQVALQMTDPRAIRLARSVTLGRRRIHFSSVNTGVPHAVVPVRRLNDIDVDRLGRRLRWHPSFRPQGTNVDFLEVDSRIPHHLRIRTYERGVEGETLACGTGVTAAAVIQALQREGARNGREGRRPSVSRFRITTKGGETLTVSVTLRMQQVTQVTLEGSVRWIGRGQVPWPTEERG